MPLQSLDFTGVAEGYRRNGCSPFEGIDTDQVLQSQAPVQTRRNGCSPFEGIDTRNIKNILVITMDDNKCM